MQYIQHPPDAKLRLWQAIEAQSFNGHHFARHVLIEPFIVDMACIEIKVVVELDEANVCEQQPHNNYRTQYLREHGYKVFRFFRDDVSNNMTQVLSQLKAQLN